MAGSVSVDLAGKVAVKQDKRGVWYARPYLGKLPSGRVAKPYKSFPEAKSREEAQALADAWAAKVTADGRVRSTTLADMLDEYIRSMEDMGASPHSVRTYRLYASRYCASLAGKRVGELSSMDFAAMERRLLKGGGVGGSPLSGATVRGVYQFLRGAYGWMKRNGIVDSNPLLEADKPTPEKYEAVALDEADLRVLMRWISPRMSGDEGPHERVRAFRIWIALHCGLRVGEVCALRLRDISPARRLVRVTGTVVDVPGSPPWRKDSPKTKSSRRAVTVTEGEAGVLREYLSWRERGGGGGQDSPLCSIGGAWPRPSDVSADFSRLRGELGMESRATFHTLRHTHASWCIAEGVDFVTLSERLGHASPSVTMNVYGHLLSGRDAAAAKAFSAAMEGLTGC